MLMSAQTVESRVVAMTGTFSFSLFFLFISELPLFSFRLRGHGVILSFPVVCFNTLVPQR